MGKLLVGSFLLSVSLLAQTNSVYRFSVNQDALNGAPDYSYLNHTLTPADRLFVRDGHFFRVGSDQQANTSDDERVKLFGVNMVFGANFPEGADAVRVAQRLRRLGVNLVRLHHMDTNPDETPDNAGSILTTGPFPTLNPVAVTRLRTFLDALRQEGIYADLNLHVGYTFRPAIDQVASPWDSGAFPPQSKPLQNISANLIALQQKFATSLIGALKLGDDPVLGIVEINNESSLIHSWQQSEIDWYVAGPYYTEFQARWNEYLKTRYANTATLNDRWGASQADSGNLLNNQWNLEVHYPAQAQIQGGSADGTAPATITISQGGAPVIAKQTGFSVQLGSAYVAEAELRADIPDGASRTVYWDIKQDSAPYLTETGNYIQVTNQWQKFRLNFRPAFGMDGNGRFGFSVETVESQVAIRNATLIQLGPQGLSANQSLEAGTVALVSANESATLTRANDYLAFLADRDAAYLGALKQSVRDAAGPLVPITGTQMGYGGMLNLDSQSAMDFQDNHLYVDHYIFPHVQWDERDWGVTNDSVTKPNGLRTLLNVAAGAPINTPFTVTEFNQPWPNQLAAAADPMIASLGAFQDWDAIVHFAYSHDRGWDLNIPNGFNMNGDWAKFAVFGQSAWLFRTGQIQAGRQTMRLPISRDERLTAGREKRNGDFVSFLGDKHGYDPLSALLHPVRLAPTENAESFPDSPTINGAPTTYQSDTGELTYDPAATSFTIQTPQALGFFGSLPSGSATLGAATWSTHDAPTDFTGWLLTAVDGHDLASAGRMLLSVPGYTLRSQPNADTERPAQLVPYPGIPSWITVEPDLAGAACGSYFNGIGPSWMQQKEAWLTLKTPAASLTVYPLDGSGNRQAQLSDADVQKVDGGFVIHLQAAGQTFSPWYDISASY